MPARPREYRSGARETTRFARPDGTIMHAEVRIGDPVGNHWWLAAHIEDVPPEEMRKRAQALAQ